tara:strand:- start:1811 stop:2329 length:519 start_codon:yes stop_codon:yes gene_type:complete
MKKLYSLLALLVLSCAQGQEGDGNGGGPPNRPVYDFEEQEPNDSFKSAQFLTLLPEWSQRNLKGHLDPVEDDLDFYYFFLNLNAGDDELLFNLVLECEPWLTQRVSFYQTIYSPLGEPTDYQLLGTFVGAEGQLIILDLPVPYHSFTNNDLFMVIEGFGIGYTGYVLEFWTG